MLTCILTFDLANFKRHIMFLISIHHWIGLRENLQENVRFHGEMDCFRLFFFLKPIQSIQRIGPVVTVVTVVCHLPRQFLPCRILSYRRSAMVHQSQKTASSTVDFRRCPLVVSQPRQILKYIEIYWHILKWYRYWNILTCIDIHTKMDLHLIDVNIRSMKFEIKQQKRSEDKTLHKKSKEAYTDYSWTHTHTGLCIHIYIYTHGIYHSAFFNT